MRRSVLILGLQKKIITETEELKFQRRRGRSVMARSREYPCSFQQRNLQAHACLSSTVVPKEPLLLCSHPTRFPTTQTGPRTIWVGVYGVLEGRLGADVRMRE